MNDLGPEHSFRGLPLSAEQESEIQHYIRQRLRRGQVPDDAELRAMLEDMLNPPVDESLVEHADAAGVQCDAERAAGLVDGNVDSITAREEHIAASEAQAMKRSAG